MRSEEQDKLSTFDKYKKLISEYPNQIIRYGYDILPLKTNSKPLPSAIPKCKCGLPRKFEFQVLSTVIYKLKMEEDWGGLWVYTCEGSCGVEGEEVVYVEEGEGGINLG